MNTQHAQPETRHIEVEQGLLDKIIASADLTKLTQPEKSTYYQRVCESLELNPLTKPFEYLWLKGKAGEPDKLILYATKSATDQLRDRRGITLTVVKRELAEGVYVVTAVAKTPDGRQDEDDGAVSMVVENGTWQTNDNGKRFFRGDGTFRQLTGDARANAMMKAVTKAKRRVTLSICGLGMLDESEIDSIPGASRVDDHHASTPAPALLEPPKVDPKPEPPQTKPPSFAAQLQAVQAEIGALPKEELGDTSETLEKAYQAKMPGARGERAGQLQRAVREAWLRAWISFLDPNEFTDFRSTIRESGLKAERIETLLADLNTAEAMLTETVA